MRDPDFNSVKNQELDPLIYSYSNPIYGVDYVKERFTFTVDIDVSILDPGHEFDVFFSP